MPQKIIEWKEEYCLNIQSIDEQHKALVNMIFNVQRSLMEGTSVKLLRTLIIDLVDFLLSHIEYEEAVFREIKYSHTNIHTLEHDLFKNKARKFHDALKDETIDKKEKHKITIEIMDFITSWFVGHMIETDKQFQEEFMKANVE